MNGARALTYLVSTLFDLYIVSILLRLMLQWVRADFYNPLCQFLVRITNPLLIPLRRVIPSMGRLDTASVVLALALELISLALISLINGFPLLPLGLLSLAVIKLLMAVLWLYFFLILISIILSWVGGRAQHPIVPLVFSLTEPVLRPVRQRIPPISGFDFSPLIVLITIRFIILLLGY